MRDTRSGRKREQSYLYGEHESGEACSVGAGKGAEAAAGSSEAGGIDGPQH